MWRFPTDDRHVPPGGEFMSEVLDNGKRRTLPHSGLDYSHFPDSPIYVIGPGVVVARGTSPRTGWGYHVWVDHGDTGDGRHAYSYYAHMRAIGPKVGTRFKGGEVIGHIGATGSGITGEHLHWGVALARPRDLYKVTIMDARSRDYLADPAAFVAARITGTAGGETDPFNEPEPWRDTSMPMLYGTTTPATGATKAMLAQNPGLAPGKPTYLLAGTSPGSGPRNGEVTQDQVLAAAWARQLGGPADNPGSVIVAASWGWFVQIHEAMIAPLSIAGAIPGGGSVQVDLTDVVAAIEKLGVKIDALPAEIDAYSDGRK